MKRIPFLFAIFWAPVLAGTTAMRGGGYPSYKLGDTATLTVATSPIQANAPVYRYRTFKGRPDGEQPTLVGYTNSQGVYFSSVVLTTGLGGYNYERFAVGTPTSPTSADLNFTIETPAPAVDRGAGPFYIGDTITLEVRTSALQANMPVYRWRYYKSPQDVISQPDGPQPTQIGVTDDMGRFVSSVTITTGVGDYTLESFAVGSETGYRSTAQRFTIYPARQAPIVLRSPPAPNYHIGDQPVVSIATDPPQPFAAIYRFRLFNGQPDGPQPTLVATTDYLGKWWSQMTLSSGIGSYTNEQWTVGSPAGLRSPIYGFTIAPAVPQPPIVNRAAPYPAYRIGDTMTLELLTNPIQANQPVYRWITYYGTTTGPVQVGTTDANGTFRSSQTVTNSLSLGSYANEQFAVGLTTNPRSFALNYQILPALEPPLVFRPSPYPYYFIGDDETLVLNTDPVQAFQPIYRYRYRDGFPDGDQPTLIGTTDGNGYFYSRTRITEGVGEYTSESFTVGSPNGLRSQPMSYLISDENPGVLEFDSVEPQVIERGQVTRVRLRGRNFTENTTLKVATRSITKAQPIITPTVSIEGISMDGTEMFAFVDTRSSSLSEPFYNLELREGEQVKGSPIRVLEEGPVVDGYSPASIAGGNTYAFTIHGAHLIDATVALSDPNLGHLEKIQSGENYVFGIVTLNRVHSYQTFYYKVTRSGKTVWLPAEVTTNLSANARNITESTLPPETDNKDVTPVPPIYVEPVTVSDSLASYQGYAETVEDLEKLPWCVSASATWTAVYRASHSLITFNDNGLIGPISGVLGIGESLNIHSFVLSLNGIISVTIGWDACSDTGVSRPYFCVAFAIFTQIPGRSQTFTQVSCSRNVSGGTMTPERGSPAFGVEGGSCANVSNLSMTNGIGSATVTQRACCEQPIILNMRCSDALPDAFWGCFDFRRFSGSSTPSCAPPPAIQVTGVEYLEPGGTWVSINQQLDVLDGTTVQFRARKNTPDPWPPGQPTWSGLNLSGSGEIISSTFTGTGNVNIQVSSGSGGAIPYNFNVTIYDIIPVVTPAINFPGRSYAEFGLNESVTLSFTTVNPSFNPANMRYQWTNSENVNTSNNNYIHTFGTSPMQVVFTLTVTNGPSKGETRTKTVTLIAPGAGRIFHMTCAGTYHVQGRASVGFVGLTTLLPDYVAFPGLVVREGAGTSSGSGYFANIRLSHTAGPLQSVQRDPRYGNYWGYDQVIDDWSGPYTAGSSIWPIAWQYQNSTGQFVNFAFVNHDTIIQANGAISVTKGQSPLITTSLNDANANFNPSCLQQGTIPCKE